MNPLNLQVITKKEDSSNYLTDFREIIEKKKLLKAKLKLLQIAAIDQDVQELIRRGLTIYDLKLEDFKLTHSYQLSVPVQHKIIRSENDLKLRSYFIYLSYLYNFDFMKMYEKKSSNFYKLLLNIFLPPNMRDNLMNLLCGLEGDFFSSYLGELNTTEFRNALYETSKTLHLRTKFHS